MEIITLRDMNNLGRKLRIFHVHKGYRAALQIKTFMSSLLVFCRFTGRVDKQKGLTNQVFLSPPNFRSKLYLYVFPKVRIFID